MKTRVEATALGRSAGTIEWFDVAKRYGFVHTEAGADAFFHADDVTGERYPQLGPGDVVEFDLQRGPKGLRARRVVCVKET